MRGGKYQRALQGTVCFNLLNGEPQVAYSPRFADVPEDEWHTDTFM